MASYVKYQDFVEQLGLGKHNLHTDTIKAMLSNTAPNVATHTVRADVSEISGGNGYTSGGEDIQNTYSETGGTGTVACVDIVWTGSGAGFGPFRYVETYNDTQTSPADPLINYWDYGASISILSGETFTLDFGSNKLFDIS